MMPQITLSVPQEKLPLLQKFLLALGIEGYRFNNLIANGSLATEVINHPKQELSSWEYYCNELEYE